MKVRFRDWSSLPAELIENISDLLSADTDTIHIHQVCSHWRASTAPLAAPRPWVVAGRPHGGPLPKRTLRPVGCYSLWLPRGRGRVPVCLRRRGAPQNLPDCCVGTPRGWLALTTEEDAPAAASRLVLWEPISRSEISLPYLRDAVQVFLSADPLDSPPGWMALATRRSRGCLADGNRLAYWRPGDAAWADLAGGHSMCPVNSVAFHRGRLYFTAVNGGLFGYDLNNLGGAASPAPPERALFFNTTGMFNSSVCDCCQFHPVRAVHVVACGGDLLLVAFGQRIGTHRRGGVVRVYRPDLLHAGDEAAAAAMSRRVVEAWERVSDLGEYSLFLGRGDAFALSADAFPGIERNRVYYVEHDRQCQLRYWNSVFDLSSNACEQVRYPVEHRDDGSQWWPFTWFCPRRPFLDR
ncbi:unnamed protein product [Urochloa decumbens]|uniref:KIB1-4 beta-propeller domain-containing protein n=1 Tax=Urochloa decumbens TaxID=240449 RepID=A0ABC9CS77_9POAL